jgi:hypothetical protein
MKVQLGPLDRKWIEEESVLLQMKGRLNGETLQEKISDQLYYGCLSNLVFLQKPNILKQEFD